MTFMFFVRSARALSPSLESGQPRACRSHRPRPTPSASRPALHALLSNRHSIASPCPTPTSC
eukprot:scaffold54309_cov67-Phaeocystis_antarctica.AAC.1